MGLSALLLLPIVSFAQDAGAANNSANFWENTFGSIALLAGSIVVLASLIAIVRLFNVIVKMEELRVLKDKGVEAIVEQYQQPQQSWWKKIMKSATQYVPIEKEEDIMFDHEYDGIRELDNRLPPWWLWMFYGSIIFAAVYWTVFHVADGPSLIDEYNTEMEVAQANIDAYKATKADAIDENTVELLSDEESLSMGQSTFQTLCMPCHGMNGEGNSIGPNLTDDYWLHGCGIKNVFKTITNGVIEKGMQSWKEQLRPVEIQRVASYIVTKLHGSDPANPKDPQGDLCKAEVGDNNSAPAQEAPEEAPTENANE